MVTFDFALDTVMQLPQVEREELIEILKKRQSQEWRKDTADYYQELKEVLKSGNITPVAVNDALMELHNYVNSPD
ncbi:MAG: hypothetical protein HW421_236 [Ignavibacteria bacterium]|nr:hypothetical protein [Ignavibacteria bacterium]